VGCIFIKGSDIDNMKKLNLEELHNFAWLWLVEGERFNTLTPEQSLFLYDVMVVLNKVKQSGMDIIVNDETQRNMYVNKCEI